MDKQRQEMEKYNEFEKSCHFHGPIKALDQWRYKKLSLAFTVKKGLLVFISRVNSTIISQDVICIYFFISFQTFTVILVAFYDNIFMGKICL